MQCKQSTYGQNTRSCLTQVLTSDMNLLMQSENTRKAPMTLVHLNSASLIFSHHGEVHSPHEPTHRSCRRRTAGGRSARVHQICYTMTLQNTRDGEGCETYILFPALLPVTFNLTDILSDMFLTSCWHEPDILSDISFDIFLTFCLTFFLTDLLTFCLTFFLTDLLTFCLTFFLTDLLTFCLAYLLTLFLTFFFLTHFAVEVRRGTLASQDRGWGPARNTELTGSRLRSGAEHWTHRIAVEVRRGTLNSPDRGWGPARNTELTWSRLRSGTEHWAHIIAVGDEEDTEDAEKEEEKKEKTTHIKSNNPHLTGGE